MHPCRLSPLAARRARLALVAAHLAFAAATATAAMAAPAAGRQWTSAPPARWVRELALPDLAAPPRAEPSSGKVYRLVDHQVRVDSPTVDYNRLAWTVLSTEGVQNA